MGKGFNDLDAIAERGTYTNLLLVDGLNLAFRYKHKGQRNFAADYVRTVESFANSYKCSKIVICSDLGSSVYRRGIYPEYKGNREAKKREQSQEEAQAFFDFLQDFDNALELCEQRFPVLKFKGVEADDIIAYIAQNSSISNHIWIISSDKDLDQLVSDRVSRFSYVTRKEITKENFYETYGCSPSGYISIKVLTGDAGDNVPGVALIGPKRAAALVQKYGSALDIYDMLPLPGTQKVIKNLNDFGDQILINYELMDLGFAADALGNKTSQVMEFIDNNEL